MGEESSIVRIDRNLAEKSIDWLMAYKEDFRLCFDIIIYITNVVQRDLFNYGVIDLNEFAKKMGYKKNNLQAITTPIQKELVGPIFENLEREKKFITVFENALFKLGRFNVPIQSLSVDTNTNERILQTHFIQILKEISINIMGSSKNSKIVYSYKTSEEFDYNLSRLFFLADFNLIPELRNKNLLQLYCYLKALENSKHHTFIEKDFIKLCTMANIHIDTSTDQDPSNKRKIKDSKDKLKRRKLTLIKNYIDFDFEDINVSGKYNYGFKFLFHQNKEIGRKDVAEATREREISILNKASEDFIMSKVIKFYRAHKGLEVDQDKDRFKKWFLSNATNIEQKQNIYFNAMARLHSITLETATKRHQRHFLEFFSENTLTRCV